MTTCPLCGAEIPPVRIGRPRRFCSDRCRESYKGQRGRALANADALERNATVWDDLVGKGIASDDDVRATAREIRQEARELRRKWRV